jgi:hypothetical protein
MKNSLSPENFREAILKGNKKGNKEKAVYKREGRPPAIAKEAWVYRNIIKPKCRLWEVFDEERNIILRTTIANFDVHCEEWHWNDLVQLLMEEPYWQIERLGAPQLAQARLL